MSYTGTPTRRGPRTTTPTDPELVDRLARLRTVLPLLASDLAASRRRANELEARNRQLSRRVAELESRLTEPPASAPS